MDFILQPDDWSCDLCAHAMALGISYNRAIEIIGHDGSFVRNPGEKHPFDKEAFCPRQLTWLCLKLGYASIIITIRAKVFPPLKSGNYFTDEEFFNFLKGKTGILTAKSKTYEQGYHCVGWDGEKVYDPRFGIANIDDYDIGHFNWIFKI